MNKKDECEIVKDLSIPYLEELVNKGSKNFIEEHLKICNDCSEYYKNVKSEMFNENNKEKDKDDVVVNQFKKINRHINILKLCLIVILIFIIIICSTFYVKCEKTSNIINNAYSKIEYMKELNNYKLTVKTIQKNYKTNDAWEYEQNYYYKDGKYKIESSDSIKFYEDDSYEKVCVYHDLNTIEYYKQNIIEETKGRMFDIFSEIINYKTLISKSKFYSLTLSLREDRYNGTDCYVIRFGNKDDYRDVWLNKDNFITVRVIDENYKKFYREVIYIFNENIVTSADVDISILSFDKYKDYDIINNK